MAALCVVVDECKLAKGDGPKVAKQEIAGTIHVADMGNGQTRARCDLRGLTPGPHGLHVHRCGDLSKGCASTCDHYNPDKTSHGGPTGPNRHRGDFGNLVAAADGTCRDVIDADVTVAEIVGRAFVIHQ